MVDKTGTGKFLVEIIESERGWGSRLDEIRRFTTEKEAKDFIIEYNKRNNLPEVPDWYMYAQYAGKVK